MVFRSVCTAPMELTHTQSTAMLFHHMSQEQSTKQSIPTDACEFLSRSMRPLRLSRNSLCVFPSSSLRRRGSHHDVHQQIPAPGSFCAVHLDRWAIARCGSVCRQRSRLGACRASVRQRLKRFVYSVFCFVITH